MKETYMKETTRHVCTPNEPRNGAHITHPGCHPPQQVVTGPSAPSHIYRSHMQPCSRLATVACTADAGKW
eukprot:1161981-Pelagomonas_calceolata.AAC.10